MMEDWRYGDESFRSRLRSRSRSPTRTMRLRDRDYDSRRMIGNEERYDRFKVEDYHREVEVAVVGDREREYRKMYCGGDRRRSPHEREVQVVRDGREYDRMRGGDQRHSSRGREVEGVRIGNEYDRARVDNERHSSREREVYVVSDRREYNRMRGGDQRNSSRGREVEAVRDDNEYDRMRGGDERHSSLGREVNVVNDRREYDRMRGDDKRPSPRGSEIEVVRDGPMERGRRDRVYYAMRVADRRCFPTGSGLEVVIDGPMGRSGGDGEYYEKRDGDRSHSSSGREVEVLRDGNKYDMMRVGDRMHSSWGGEVDVLRDGNEYDMMRVDDQRYCSRGREVEVVRDDNQYDRMRMGNQRHCSRGREVEVEVLRDDNEYDGMRSGNQRHSSRGREVELVRVDNEYDIMTAGHRMHSSQRREVEVVRDGRGCDTMMLGDRRHSQWGREVDVVRDNNEYDMMSVGDQRHSSRGRDTEVVRDGREYDRIRVDDRRHSPRRRELEVKKDGREYQKTWFTDGDYSLEKREMCATCSVAEHSRQIIDHTYSLNQREMNETCNGEEYDERIAEIKYSLMQREIEGIRSEKDYGVSCMLDQESPMFPGVEKRLMDDYVPEQVRLRDYDRAPPDVVNRGRDHDDGLPWSMGLSRDDHRAINRDNVNNNGLLKRSYYQFDDSLSNVGSNSLKFQNSILEEQWKADAFRSNREFGVNDARMCSDKDNFDKQSMDAGLLERFLDNNRMSLKSGSGRGCLSSCPSDQIGLANHCGGGSCGHSLMPHMENVYRKHVGLHGDPYLNKLTGDRPFKGDENTLGSSKDEYDYVPSSSSMSKVFSTMTSDGYVEELSPLVKETHNIGSDEVVFSCGISDKPLTYDGHGQKPVLGSPIIYARHSNDNRCYSQTYLAPPGEHKSSAYQEVGRNVDDHIGPGSRDIYGNSRNFVEYYGCQESLRAQNLEHYMDRERYQLPKQERSSDGSQQWDPDPYSRRHLMPDYVNAVGSSHLKKQDMDILDNGDSHHQHDIEIHDNCVPYKRLEYHERKKDHCFCHHDRSEIMRSGQHYLNMDGVDHSPSQKLFLRNLNLSEPSKLMIQHRHLTSSISCESCDTGRMSSSLQSARKTNDEGYIKEAHGADELDFSPVSKKSKHSSSRYENTGNGCSDLSSRLTDRNLSQPLASVLSKDTKSSGRDIKSRLGPSLQNAQASCSVAKKHKKSSAKKQLEHCPLPRIKNLNELNLSIIQKDSDGYHDQEEDILGGTESSRRLGSKLNVPNLSELQQGSDGHLEEGEISPANEIFRIAEPPENSEEFKQLVHHNFFKFVKQLKETSIRRRKFMDHGNSGTSKCLVCGSDSPEFPDTESLVMHALSCDKVGSKCHHLGFHQALCVLMGWRSAELPDTSWVCELLTDAEISALKDDLIIWPPVVVVHNSTIANVPEKRITLSVEEFEAKLRGMGFGDETKVTLGRPANRGTMVVRFGPTFSSLQEAERLHKIFLDFNRGRTGFLQLNSSSSGNYREGLPVASGDELQPFLYGYIGILDDLDKLDFEIKRRSLIKSKTEILVIADDSNKKEGTADAMDEKEAISDTTDEKEVAADEKEATADATDEKEVTADPMDEKEVTADATNEKELAADATDGKELTTDSSDKKGVTADSTDGKEVTADATDEKEVTANAADKKEIIADTIGK